MPLVKIHVLEGQYDERRLSNVSKAVQAALMSVLKIPPTTSSRSSMSFRNRFFAHAVICRMKYSTISSCLKSRSFSAGRRNPPALLKELNARIAAGAGISPDDLMIGLFEGQARNFSFRSGIGATRVHLTDGLRDARHALT